MHASYLLTLTALLAVSIAAPMGSAAPKIEARQRGAAARVAALQALQGTSTNEDNGTRILSNGEGSCIAVQGRIQCSAASGQSFKRQTGGRAGAAARLAALQALQGTSTNEDNGTRILSNGEGSCIAVQGRIQCSASSGQSFKRQTGGRAGAAARVAALQALQGTSTNEDNGTRILSNGEGSCIAVQGTIQCSNSAGGNF